MLKDHEAAIKETLSALIEYLYHSTEDLKEVDIEEVYDAKEILKRIYNEI